MGAVIIVQTKAMARLLMGSDHKPILRLRIFHICLIVYHLLSFPWTVLFFVLTGTSIVFTWGPQGTPQHTQHFRQKWTYFGTSTSCLLQELAFLCLIFPMQKEKYIFSWLRLKINFLMPRLFICSSSFLVWLGSSFHLRIFFNVAFTDLPFNIKSNPSQ